MAMAFLQSARQAANGRSRDDGEAAVDWRRRAAALDARRGELERLLVRGDETLILWDGSGAERHFSAADGDGSAGLDGVRARLAPADSARLAVAVERLLATGEPFAFRMQTADGGTLELEGRTGGAAAALWVRDASVLRSEVAQLRAELAAARDEAERMRRVADLAPLPIWLRDAGRRLVWTNARYAEAVELGSAREAVARNENLLPPAAADDLGRLKRQRVVIGAEPRTLDAVELPLDDGVAGFAFDITEGEAARAAFDRHVEGQHALLDTMSTAVTVFDPDRHLSFFNPAFSDLARLQPRWLDEQPHHGDVLEAMRAQRRLPEEIDFRAWKARILDLHTSLREPLSEMWHLADGATLHVMAQPHPAGGLIFLYEDVTDRLGLERSYNALIGVQRETLDNLFEGVALFGPGGRLELFNPAFAALWDLDPETLIDRPHVDRVFGACAVRHDDPAFWAGLKGAIAGIGAERSVLRGRIERIDEVVIDYTGVPLPDGATLLTWQDVTDSVRIQRALRERADALETADRLKGAFIAHVSYQLRTPLNAIIGFGEILEHEYFGPLTERQHEYTRGVLDASEELMRLIEDMLDLATIEAGNFQLDFDTFDILPFLERAVDKARERLGEDLTIRIDCPPDIGALRADERRLRQVMRHLIANAIQASAPDDTLVLGTERDADEVRIWLRDNGAGVAPEDRDAIFAKFESRPVDPGQRGAGLGLTLVRSLIELHGGRFELVSEPGRGTRVVCHLPQPATPA